MRILSAVLAGLFSLTVSAHANTINYTFTYSGTGNYEGGTATGTGSFTVSYTPGSSTGSITSFSFSDTITSTVGSSTFTYNSLASSAVTLTTGATPTISNLMLTTPYATGSNSGFGSVDFSLSDSAGTISESTADTKTSTTLYLSGFTGGGGTVLVAPAATPEPSSLALLGTGILGLAGAVRRRILKQKA